MPYMKNDTISQSPIDGGIEISDAQYQVVYEAMLEGKPVTVRNDAPFIYSGDKRTVYRLIENFIESQDIWTEDATPEGWQDTEPTPEPEQKTKFSAREFLGKLTLDEKIALKTSDDIQVQIWYDELIAADFVDIEDQDVESAIDYGIFKGIFTELRKTQLLTPE